MTTTPHATSPAFFDRLYGADLDPWGFASDPYELGRYQSMLENVPQGRFAAAFEPGCSIGVFTAQLAERCEHVLAVDISVVAVERCRERCADLRNVDVAVADLEPPPGRGFDLVVLSEVGYYSTRAALANTMDCVSDAVRPQGRVIALHWIGESSDHTISGDEVHETIGTALRTWRHSVARRVSDHSHVGYRLDVWDRHGG